MSSKVLAGVGLSVALAGVVGGVAFAQLREPAKVQTPLVVVPAGQPQPAATTAVKPSPTAVPVVKAAPTKSAPAKAVAVVKAPAPQKSSSAVPSKKKATVQQPVRKSGTTATVRKSTVSAQPEQPAQPEPTKAPDNLPKPPPVDWGTNDQPGEPAPTSTK